MGVSIGFGIGPVRVSKRLRGPKLPTGSRRSGPRPDPVPEGTWEPRIAMSEERLRLAHRLDWTVAVVLCVFSVAMVLTAPLAVVIPILVRRKHRREHEQRAEAARAAQPVLDPIAEARRAEGLGLVESARMWRSEAARMVMDAPTETLRVQR